MKLVVDISEDKYDLIRMAAISGLGDFTYKIIANGTPLPDDEQAEWIDDKCSNCGKGIEDLIDSREWYKNEKPNFCPFCGKKFKESEVK